MKSMSTSAATIGTTSSQMDSTEFRRDSSGCHASTEHGLEYMLERGESESERLNRQHYKLYKLSNGELLDMDAFAELKATYEKEKRPLLIADIGTGTAVWPSHVMRKLESLSIPVELHGFDISDTQFPPDAPPTLKLHVHNVVDPPPAEFRNMFDYVHVRLLISGLTKPDWAPAVKNCADMLRPGGFLDWEDLNMSELDGEPSGVPAFEKVRDFIKNFLHTVGKCLNPIDSMPSQYEASGLKLLRQPYQYPIDSSTSVSTRVWMNVNGLLFATSFVKAAEASPSDELLKSVGVESREEAAQMLDDLKTVFKERPVYFNWPFYRVVGKKL